MNCVKVTLGLLATPIEQMLFHFLFYAEEMDIGARLKLYSLMQGMSSDVVVGATAAGDTSTLRDFLTSHPQEVHTLA